MNVHVARLGTFTVDANGSRIDKNSPSTTINMMKGSTSMAQLVIPDTDYPNTAGYPTVKAYLTLEASGGFKLRHLDQSFIITDNG